MAIRKFDRVIPPKISGRTRRYRADPMVRERIKNQSRSQYRRKANMELGNCLHSLSFLEEMSTVRNVTYPNGVTKDVPTLTLARTADALQKLYQTIWRWVSKGWVPAPVLRSNDRQSKPYYVYHLEEVRALVTIIGEHEKIVAYFRGDHDEVRDRIKQRFTELRNQLAI